ncbi:MAG: serine/threonine-protein kinase [Phycisphaerales bacterium]|nr:serine/threonine-protein kinase [Phycisphaerales bacterium]MCI0629999.1 serine/threonine-protein kinase [Phycisphaerales bacterium]MCI0677231.1 serine/threonine-protein kinase [Phycisphaerales bacterium]
MNTANEQQAAELFFAALDYQVQERVAFLERACAHDKTLRAKVENLLAADDSSVSFLKPPDEDSPEFGPVTTPIPAGTNIGRYKLLELIGEGGFGAVYSAEQCEPIQRRVALKIIKLGMDTKQVIARFEAERQALAMMDHSNIAKVLDAGATDIGRPFFVMELVRGDPITDCCDRGDLSINQRLELFGQVCSAVQHAHQKGIIHRDIKPSNVLMTVSEDKLVPKVIDFGIAKATSVRLTDKTIFTENRALIGTPHYMSPEQAEMSGVDIDTRTDIYSLGVLLYELLTGTTPFDAQRLRTTPLDQMRRIIREEEPPKPSTRLSTMGEAVASVAADRHTEPAKLMRIVRGDLDWIVMKCLEKDRTRRYQTANDLALDVQRYLNGEPVLAAPPSRVYRLRKQIRRHRWAVVTAAGSAVLVAAGLGISVALWRQAAAARDAQTTQHARADAVGTFLKDMLTLADPARARGDQLTVREALDAAAQRLEAEPLKDQPMVESDLRATIGTVYSRLGVYTEAETHLRTASALLVDKLGYEHPDTLRTQSALALALLHQSRHDEAATLAEGALRAQRRVLGSDHADTLGTMLVLGRALGDLGRFVEAEPLLRDAIERRRRVFGENDPGTADALNALGRLYTFHRRPNKAEPLHREALRIQRAALDPRDPSIIASMTLLGGSLHNQHRASEAEPIFREALGMSLHILGPDHPQTLGLRGNLAAALYRQSRFSEAEAILGEVLEAQSRLFGPSHASPITTKRFLAGALVGQGRYEDAERMFREALDAAREHFGPEHFDTSVRLMCALTSVLEKLHKDAQAEQLGRQVMEIQRRALPDVDLAELDQAWGALIRVLQRQGNGDEALLLEKELLEILVAGARRPDAPAGTFDYAAVRLLNAQSTELRDPLLALELALEANERSSHQNPRHLETLAQAYELTGHITEAIDTQLKSIGLSVDGDARCLPRQRRLAEIYASAGMFENATAVLGELVDRQEALNSDDARTLAKLYDAWHIAEPDKGYDAKAAQWRAKLDEQGGDAGKREPSR